MHGNLISLHAVFALTIALHIITRGHEYFQGNNGKYQPRGLND
jgi:hypothetical protein